MSIILGIDPGSRMTGFGVIESNGYKHRYIASGCIKTQTTVLADRCYEIFCGILQVIDRYQPHEVGIEQVFMKVNVSAALKLGHARGAALVAVSSRQLVAAEYSPRQVKKAVVGYGAAEKSQMQHMVKMLLKLSEAPAEDASDALAIAICHSHSVPAAA